MTVRTHEGLSDVLRRIEAAAEDAKRRAEEIELVAVSKTFDAEHIRPVIDAGQRVFGENRVQEAMNKWPALRKAYDQITLHLIGPLQTNKVRDAVALFDCIETVDRPKLAGTLAKEMKAQGKAPSLFIQVNTGEEPQKAGILPSDTDEFVWHCRNDLGLDIVGLMCIPPVHEEAALHFALLGKIAARNGLPQLSMGMSSDFEKAITFGATHVRVGSAIFGARSYPVD